MRPSNSKKIAMKIVFNLIFFLFCIIGLRAQNSPEYKIIRSNLGSSGSSNTVVTSKGTFNVSQSIGQASVIGTHSQNGIYLRQGYQQPAHNISVSKDTSGNLKARVFPNPFEAIVNITFSSLIKSNISVLVFDVNGKIVHNQNFSAAQNIQLNMSLISSGTYFLKAISGEKTLNSKLIKI